MLSTLALYLPQFHRVHENDEWWGDGFTEWTAVKGAEKLYETHNQPRIPLNNNYYNLMDRNTMIWQAELMKRYCIDGMCIYHYWFENGKRILEKPAENLLKWKDIHMPFCFCWANQTWRRTWKKLSDSCMWSSIYEKREEQSIDNGILMKQIYGRENDWEQHFQYLLPFFKDNRYIKLNGKPVFVIYRANDIPSLWNMLDFFDMRAKENHFPGIYTIGMLGDKVDELNAICLKQPELATEKCLKKENCFSKRISMYSYDNIWQAILSQELLSKKTYFCGIVDFDNSPRMGENSIIIEGASPEKFYQYFKLLYEKSLYFGNEFIFINAWNEWGESMYLEPDEINGYGYLESVRKVVTEFENELPIKKNVIIKISDKDSFEQKYNVLKRHDSLLNDWLYIKEHNLDFSNYFIKYNYNTIAIYGMGKLGMHLFHELNKGDIQVSFGIDKNSEDCDCEIKVYALNQQMPKVDAVVITVIDQYAEIGRLLSKKLNCAMVTIEEIIQELLLDS